MGVGLRAVVAPFILHWVVVGHPAQDLVEAYPLVFLANPLDRSVLATAAT